MLISQYKISVAKRIYQEKGLILFLQELLNAVWARMLYILSPLIIFCIRKTRRRAFVFLSEKYEYYFHKYSQTWRNERTVEIPIVKKIVEENEGKLILEIGNVLAHYGEAEWDIVDKHEISSQAINKDIVDYRPDNKYDLIVSISTLEHIGFEDDIIDENRVDLAIKNIYDNCLRAGGKFIFTIPVGYNKSLDSKIFSSRLGVGETYYLKRISRSNEWKECTLKEVESAKYGLPFYAANALAICVMNKNI